MAASHLPNFRLADGEDSGATKYLVKAGAATSVKTGDFVLQNTAGDVHYAKAIGTGNASTDDVVIGLAATNSTETVSVDGSVMVYDDSDNKYIGLAEVKANLADAKLLTKVIILSNATTGIQTLDEDDVTKGIARILDYNATSGEVTFRISQAVQLSN